MSCSLSSLYLSHRNLSKMKRKKEMKMEENETQEWRFIRASFSRIYGVCILFFYLLLQARSWSRRWLHAIHIFPLVSCLSVDWKYLCEFIPHSDCFIYIDIFLGLVW